MENKTCADCKKLFANLLKNPYKNFMKLKEDGCSGMPNKHESVDCKHYEEEQKQC
jgi:hypothetical protein